MDAEGTKKDVKNLGDTAALVKRLSNRSFAGLPPQVAAFVISAIMVVAEEYVVEFNFRCPCVETPECGNGANEQQLLGRIMSLSASRSNESNRTSFYSWWTVGFTASLIFLLTFLANATINCRKSEHGNYYKTGLQVGDCCFWFAQALLLASIWIILLLIDGDYVACAQTCNAYGNANCSTVNAMQGALPFSESYKQSKEFSHNLGCGIGFGLALLYLALRVASPCIDKWCDYGFFESFCYCCYQKCCCEYDKSLRPPDARKIDKEMEEYSLKLKETFPPEIQTILNKIEKLQNPAGNSGMADSEMRD